MLAFVVLHKVSLFLFTCYVFENFFLYIIDE